jgi:hypothetical protein
VCGQKELEVFEVFIDSTGERLPDFGILEGFVSDVGMGQQRHADAIRPPGKVEQRQDGQHPKENDGPLQLRPAEPLDGGHEERKDRVEEPLTGKRPRPENSRSVRR